MVGWNSTAFWTTPSPLKARKAIAVRDIRLEIPMNRECTRYMMGLNHEGGLRAGGWEWHWDTTRESGYALDR